eukprot:gene49330-60387_t
MRRLLAVHAEVTVVGTADSLPTAMEIIRGAQPELVFLDIELGGGNGFDLLAQLEPQPRIIFVTAHARHAVDAFAVAALDYLLKPVQPERLAESLARAAAAGRGPCRARPGGQRTRIVTRREDPVPAAHPPPP